MYLSMGVILVWAWAPERTLGMDATLGFRVQDACAQTVWPRQSAAASLHAGLQHRVSIILSP